MKLSFSTLGCHDYTLDQIIDCGKKFGFDGVELRHVEKTVSLWELPDFNSAVALAKAKRKIEDAGLTVSCVGASGSFAKAGLAHRAEQMELFKRWAEVARGLGCPYIRVFGGPVPDGQSMEETLKWDTEGYNEAIPVIAKYGVTMLLETHDSFSLSKTLLSLLKNLEGDFGVIWDILHPLRFGESVEDTWKNIGPWVKHVHVKDSKVFSKTDFDFMFLGEGIVPVPKIMEILKKGGYSGHYSFEWERGWHPEIPSCEEAFPRYVEYMRRFR
jgi:sugar phosphate isomerase/epimerase